MTGRRVGGLAGVLVAGALLIGGCATAPEQGLFNPESPVSAGVDAGYRTVEITFHTGSVPPPYNHSWTVILSGTEGKLVWRTNYAQQNGSWEKTFPVTADQVAKTGAMVQGAVSASSPDSGDQMVGGSSTEYRLVYGSGQEYQGNAGRTRNTAALNNTLERQAKALVPAAVWQEVSGKYQAWQDSYPR